MSKLKLLDPDDPRRLLDRYELIGEIDIGGMASVFLARNAGVAGFQRFVAIKRLHPHLAGEREFVDMFLDEARLAAAIHNPHVVPILEVGHSDAGYYLVMEYIEGGTLARLFVRSMARVGNAAAALRPVLARVMLDSLAGLHAAHELTDGRGSLLHLVHRDCSPQNILIGVDGCSRLTDFGVARAASRLSNTRADKLKGKLAYMSPEHAKGGELDRRADLFAMGVVLWEVLACRRLLKGETEAATLNLLLYEPIPRLSSVVPDIPPGFDEVCAKALERDPALRYQTALEMGDALERAARAALPGGDGVASPREVAAWVESTLAEDLVAQREAIRDWLDRVEAAAQGGPGVFKVTGKFPLVVKKEAKGGPGGGAEPMSLSPVTVEPVTRERMSMEPVTVEPATRERMSMEPATEQPVTVEPVTRERMTQPATREPATVEPEVAQPAAMDRGTDETATMDSIPLRPELLGLEPAPVSLAPATVKSEPPAVIEALALRTVKSAPSAVLEALSQDARATVPDADEAAVFRTTGIHPRVRPGARGKLLAPPTVSALLSPAGMMTDATPAAASQTQVAPRIRASRMPMVAAVGLGVLVLGGALLFSALREPSGRSASADSVAVPSSRPLPPTAASPTFAAPSPAEVVSAGTTLPTLPPPLPGTSTPAPELSNGRASPTPSGRLWGKLPRPPPPAPPWPGTPSWPAKEATPLPALPRETTPQPAPSSPPAPKPPPDDLANPYR